MLFDSCFQSDFGNNVGYAVHLLFKGFNQLIRTEKLGSIYTVVAQYIILYNHFSIISFMKNKTYIYYPLRHYDTHMV